jgi:glycosyltransferase involved in cell wall biosynthesis
VAYSRNFTRRCLAVLHDEPPIFFYQRYSLLNDSGAAAARRLGRPLVLEYNGSEVWIARHWSTPLMFEGLAARIEAANLRAADLVVVVSRPLADEVVGRGVPPERVLVNPNAVDPAVYHPGIDAGPVRRKLGLEGKLVIGFVGTFGPWHGTEILAQAVKEVAQRLPASHFLLVGDGSGMSKVRAILAEADVLDRVRLTGLVPQAETPPYLAACDILASPHVPNPDGSPFFGSPTKLFEYMAMGKGIVASDLDQIGEVLRHEETAWLVRPGDVEALSEGILRLAEDAGLRERLGAAAHAEAIRRHTWTAHVARLLQRMRALGLLSEDGVAHDGSKP